MTHQPITVSHKGETGMIVVDKTRIAKDGEMALLHNGNIVAYSGSMSIQGNPILFAEPILKLPVPELIVPDEEFVKLISAYADKLRLEAISLVKGMHVGSPLSTKERALMIDGFEDGYQAKASKGAYSEEQAEQIYMRGYMDKSDGKDHTKEKLSEYLQSLNKQPKVEIVDGKIVRWI